jgi:predicted histone-like DNA-binding protein
MIDVKRIPKRNPMEPETAPRFYASAIHDARVDLDSLATSVAERCSLKRADVHGVLVALMDIIPNELLDGNIVSLGQLGSFYVSIKSEGAETEEEVTPALVKGSKIQYRPTKELKKKLRMIDVRIAS